MTTDSPRLVAEVSKLVRSFHGRVVISSLDLKIKQGEIVVLLGKSGCGKTTLLRTLAGLRPAVSGELRGAAARVLVGHSSMLQDELDAASNLRWTLALGAGPSVSDGVVQAWLDEWQVPQGRPVRYLSAGQRRKLALAPLSLQPCPVWLLDEPLDALDQQALSLLGALAHRHLAGGGALMLSSHQTLPADFPPCHGLALGQRRMPVETTAVAAGQTLQAALLAGKGEA